MDNALNGKRVVITRARHQAATLADALEALGATVIEFPTIEIRPPATDHELGSLAGFDWVVFTSANAVRALAKTLADRGRSLSEVDGARICVVGPATRAVAEACGLRVDLVPDEFVAESVMDAFRTMTPDVAGQRFLLPRADIAREFLPRALRDAGAHVTEVVVYDTVCPERTAAEIDSLLKVSPDFVTFTSSSTARNFAAILGVDRARAIANRAQFVSIGPETTRTMRESGLPVAAQAETFTIDGLVETIVQLARERGA